VELSPVSSDANPWRYCGEYYDKETDTIYLRARNYHPKTGRFTQEDTHWNPGNSIYGDDPLQIGKYTYAPNIASIMQSGNLYAYCINNPVTYYDKKGKFIFSVKGLYVYPLFGKNGQVNALITEHEISWGIFDGADFNVTCRLLQDGKEVASSTNSGLHVLLSASTNQKTSYWTVEIKGTFGDQNVSYTTDPILFNKAAVRYPTYFDFRSGKVAFEPPTDLVKVPVSERVKWTTSDRNKYRKWYENTYNGGKEMDWSGIEIHHIIPLAYGGTNDYSNLIPLPKAKHQEFSRWWDNY